jgi:hypothetical protein
MLARVWLDRQDVVTGDLPEVCVITGMPADDLVPVRFTSLPAWTFLLLFAGILPFLIAAWFAPQRIEGLLPVQASALRAYHRRRRRSWLSSGGTLVALAATVASDAPRGLVIAAIAALVVAFVGVVVVDQSFADGQVDRSGAHVELRHVHARFVQAVEQDRAVTGHRDRSGRDRRS